MESLEGTFERLRPQLLRAARASLSAADAEEVVGETALLIWGKEPREDLSRWIWSLFSSELAHWLDTKTGRKKGILYRKKTLPFHDQFDIGGRDPRFHLVDVALSLEPKPVKKKLAKRKISPLTKRQREILQRVKLGQSSSTIADCLSLSLSSVNGHLGALYKLHGVHSRLALQWQVGFHASRAHTSDT